MATRPEDAAGTPAHTAPLSVVIPTIGRPDQLGDCLSSLEACDPRPAEVLVIDQSAGPATADVVSRFTDLPARAVACPPLGIGHALNLGLRRSAHAVVLVTNDDCTVAPDWVGVAADLAAAHRGAILTGAVHPGGDDPLGVPSTKTDAEPHDFTGEVVLNALYGGNVILPRDEVLALGGFDDRPGLRVAAEDNDLCYRWLRAGRPLRYEPALRVWHHDWRSPEELRARYVEYARGDGALYAKHLLRGDAHMLVLAVRELSWGLRYLLGSLRRRLRGETPAGVDARSGIVRGLLPGFGAGLVQEVRLGRAGRSPS